MRFNKISWTSQRVRVKRWTVRRGPIYRARGVEGWPISSIAPIGSNPTDCVRINSLKLIIGLLRAAGKLSDASSGFIASEFASL